MRPGFREKSGYKEQFGLVDHETSSKDGRSEFGSFWKGFNDRNRGILDQYHKMMGSPEKVVTLSEADSNFLNDHKINPEQLPSPKKIKSMMFPTAGPQFTKKQHTTSSNYRLHLYHGLNPEGHALQCQQGTPEFFKDVVNRLLAEYYDRLTQCETDDQKLGNIVNLCRVWIRCIHFMMEIFVCLLF